VLSKLENVEFILFYLLQFFLGFVCQLQSTFWILIEEGGVLVSLVSLNYVLFLLWKLINPRHDFFVCSSLSILHFHLDIIYVSWIDFLDTVVKVLYEFVFRDGNAIFEVD
jgi:hypothetical protein